MIITIPLKTWSEANTRVHWGTRACRAGKQRGTARLYVAAEMASATADTPTLNGARIVITLTRIAPRKLDSDNLCGALKAVRDGIADALGINDGSERVEWKYSQEPGRHAVRIEIETIRHVARISAKRR